MSYVFLIGFGEYRRCRYRARFILCSTFSACTHLLRCLSFAHYSPALFYFAHCLVTLQRRTHILSSTTISARLDYPGPRFGRLSYSTLLLRCFPFPVTPTSLRFALNLNIELDRYCSFVFSVSNDIVRKMDVKIIKPRVLHFQLPIF